jgi:steroid 5-alpha reductase family enzyme
MLRNNPFYSTLVVCITYLVALGAGYFSFYHFHEKYSAFWAIFWADVVATVVVFIFSKIFKNSSLYDPYWSVIPIAIIWLYSREYDVSLLKLNSIAVAFWCTVYWGIRLTYNWYAGWPNLNHEDWRYGQLRRDNPKLAQFIDFSGIHLFPTLLVFAGLVPVLFTTELQPLPNNYMIWVGVLLFVIALYFETVADNQLRAFKKKKKVENELLNTGLWKYSRHPNYFGEQLFWWSLYAITYSPQNPWWLFLCPLSMTSLFLFISIPLMDKRMLERRPYYKEYMEKTSALFPWPPKK